MSLCSFVLVQRHLIADARDLSNIIYPDMWNFGEQDLDKEEVEGFWARGRGGGITKGAGVPYPSQKKTGVAKTRMTSNKTCRMAPQSSKMCVSANSTHCEQF